jgi:hypothetical protein
MFFLLLHLLEQTLPDLLPPPPVEVPQDGDHHSGGDDPAEDEDDRPCRQAKWEREHAATYGSRISAATSASAILL